MNKATTEAAPEAPADEGTTWDALGGGPDIDLGNPDDPGYQAVDSETSQATEQPTPTPVTQQVDPADVVPEFETEEGEFTLADLQRAEGQTDAAPETVEAQQETPATETPEPWAADPAGFDFRTLPAEDRAEAFQRFTAQNPLLALRRSMLYEGFQDKAQEASAANKTVEDLQARLQTLEAQREQIPDEQADLLAEQQLAAEYAVYEADYRRTHNDQQPNILDITRWVAQKVTAPQFEEVRPTIDTLNARAEQQMLNEVSGQMDAVKAKYPEAASQEVEGQVVEVLAAMLQARPDQALRPDDVERAFMAVRGPEMMGERQAREDAARQAQASDRRNVATVPPAAAQGAPVPGPTPNADGMITLDAVQASQRARGPVAIIRDHLSRLRGQG